MEKTRPTRERIEKTFEKIQKIYNAQATQYADRDWLDCGCLACNVGYHGCMNWLRTRWERAQILGSLNDLSKNPYGIRDDRMKTIHQELISHHQKLILIDELPINAFWKDVIRSPLDDFQAKSEDEKVKQKESYLAFHFAAHFAHIASNHRWTECGTLNQGELSAWITKMA